MKHVERREQIDVKLWQLAAEFSNGGTPAFTPEDRAKRDEERHALIEERRHLQRGHDPHLVGHSRSAR
jgi:hypothetical protein